MNAKKIKLNWYVISIVIFSAIIVISLFGRRSFEATYDAYVEASLNFDGDGVYDLLHSSYIEELSNNDNINNIDALPQYVRDRYEHMKKFVDEECIENGDYVAECSSIEDCELDNHRYHLMMLYGDNVDKIQAAKKVSIRFIQQKSDGTSEIVYTDYYFYFVKINHSWYLGELPFV